MVKIAPDDADAAVTEEDFPGKNQRADSKGNVVFLCIYLKKRRGWGGAQKHPCLFTHTQSAAARCPSCCFFVS